MKANEYRERDTDDLKATLATLTRDLWKSRFDNHTNQLDDTSKVQKLKRDIARVKTILTERAQAGVSA